MPGLSQVGDALGDAGVGGHGVAGHAESGQGERLFVRVGLVGGREQQRRNDSGNA
jgi:hypothetical protein